MDRLYAQEYRDLYERHWWWRSREDRIVSLLEEHVGARAPVSIRIPCFLK